MEGMIVGRWCHVSSSLELPHLTMAITMPSQLWLNPITRRMGSTSLQGQRGGLAMGETSSILSVLFTILPTHA